LPKQGHRIFWLCVVADVQKFCRVFLAGSICLAVPFALRLRSTEGLGTWKDFIRGPNRACALMKHSPAPVDPAGSMLEW